MAKKKVKRGLDHLFMDNENTLDSSEQKVEMISIEDITPNPYQPRKEFAIEPLNELAQSIKENGIFQPILLRKSIIGYEIISGERRFRASKIAQLDEIPAIIYDYDDKQMMEVALVENIQREDLNIIEEALSYKSLIENLDYTQEKLSSRIGKSRSHVANALRILTLPQNMRDSLSENKISYGHAKILVGIKEEDKQKEIFNSIISSSLSVRDTEKLLKERSSNKVPKVKQTKTGESNFKRIEELMIEKLGTKVMITGIDKGEIKIEYMSREDLERLLDLLKVLD